MNTWICVMTWKLLVAAVLACGCGVLLSVAYDKARPVLLIPAGACGIAAICIVLIPVVAGGG